MKTKKLFYVVMASALVLGACSKRNTPAPDSGSAVSVTITPQNPKAVYGGDSVQFTIVANTGNLLSTATYTQSLNHAAATQVGSPVKLNGQPTQRFTEEYHTQIGFTGTIKLICTVADNQGNTDTASATITVVPDISVYKGVFLSSYNDPSGYGSFFSSSNGQVYTKATAFANQSLIDMIFYYSDANKYTLAAPIDASFGTGANQIPDDSVQNWTSTTKNTTAFFNITSIKDLNSITYGAQIDSAFNGGNPFSPGTLANNLVPGQIIGFQTEGGKWGLLKIDQASGGDASGLGALTIDAVVQK